MKNFFSFIISKALWLNVVFMMLLVLIGLFGISMFLDTYTKHDKFVEVPDFKGFHFSEIEDFISDKNLRFEITDSIFDPSHKGGIILEQLPHGGELVKSNRKVYLTMNSVVPPSIILPELRDITLRQVVSKIETYGLKVDSLIYKPAECDNCVIGVLFEGEEVLPGARIEKGKSISLIIGEGIGTLKVSVPALYQLHLDEVKKVLNTKGFNMGFPDYDSTILTLEDSMNAFVFQQNPSYDSNLKVRQGTAFDIFLTLDSNKVPLMEFIQTDTNRVIDEN